MSSIEQNLRHSPFSLKKQIFGCYGMDSDVGSGSQASDSQFTDEDNGFEPQIDQDGGIIRLYFNGHEGMERWIAVEGELSASES